MRRLDRLVLRCRHRNRSVLPAKAVQWHRNVHPKENATPMNAGEFRCLPLSLRCYRSAESSLDVLTDEFREMAVKKSLVDPRFHPWVVQAGLDLFHNATQFESITTLDRFEHLTGRNAAVPIRVDALLERIARRAG